MHNMINGNEGIGWKTTSLEGELFRSFQTKGKFNIGGNFFRP